MRDNSYDRTVERNYLQKWRFLIPEYEAVKAGRSEAFRTGLSTSTVHRLLTTLENRRFVQFDRTESKWHVGARSFTVGATFARRRNFSAQAVPYLRKLRDLTRETANLAVVDDEFIVLLTRAESREIMRSLTKVGGRVAMVASGVGKAVLATYSDADVNAIIRHHGMPRLTENRSCGRASCSRNSKKSAARVLPSTMRKPAWGCAASPPWSTTIAAEPLAAISVSGMTSRITDERLSALGATVREVAAELTVALGGVMPEAKAG